MLGTLVLSALAFAPAVFAFDYKDYDNDFLDPSYILSKNFNASTAAAQQSIIEWADVLAEQGPWSVMNKTIEPPTGNKHDYMSWAPYFWPNCTGVGNTTELTPQQVWAQCPYYERDGMFNPDRLLVNDTGNFEAMSDAVFYNTLAWVLTGSSNYSANAAHYLDTWFINPDTAQTPNLQYSQMDRGPNGQIGTHTGLLDFKQMTKIASAIMILRNGSSPDWTSELNTQMNNWTTSYIEWVITSPIAYGEWTAPNNHGTYFYNQLASLYIIVDNKQNATNTINQYFSQQYLSQIQASGEQPLEAVRTHPYHYRCYNLAAMITNAKIGKFLGLDMWNTKTSTGATIQTAADFTMTVTLNTTDGDGPIWELYPSLAAVAANYGDPDGKYASFMAQADSSYPAEPYFLFNQYFTDSGLAAATPTAGGPIPTSSSTKKNAALSLSSIGPVRGWVAFIFLSAFTLLG
jgi:hypothetical protein